MVTTLLPILICFLLRISRLTLLFNFSYLVVESMRLGMERKLAAKDAIARIARKYPDFLGAIVALNKKGEHAGACHGWTFKYSVRSLNERCGSFY